MMRFFLPVWDSRLCGRHLVAGFTWNAIPSPAEALCGARVRSVSAGPYERSAVTSRGLSDSLLLVFREGRNQYPKAFGIPSEELFSAIYR